MNNYDQAKGVLEGTKRRFKRRPEDFKKYNAVIQKYIDEGHAQKVPEEELRMEPGKCHYLNHHSVEHPGKTEKRVVFNLSNKVEGVSIIS